MRCQYQKDFTIGETLKTEEVYWCNDWGEEPEDEESNAKEVRERLNKVPKLLPIYAGNFR